MAVLVTVCGCSDRIEGPDSIAEKTLHEPVTSTHAGRAAAQWRQPGSTIAVTLHGSSTCPPVPVDIDANADEGRITLTVSEDYEIPEGQGCTDDLAATTYLVRLPERLDPSHPADLIVHEDGKRDARISLRKIASVS